LSDEAGLIVAVAVLLRASPGDAPIPVEKR
jgi:hypothetical protein